MRYHGVLASRSKHRAEVVPNEAVPTTSGSCPLTRDEATHPSNAGSDPPKRPGASIDPPKAGSTPIDRIHSRDSRPSRYYSWAELMSRVFEVDVLQCPRCRAGPMRILAAIHPPDDNPGDLEVAGVADPRAADRPGAAGFTGLDAGRTVAATRSHQQLQNQLRSLTARPRAGPARHPCVREPARRSKSLWSGALSGYPWAPCSFGWGRPRLT